MKLTKETVQNIINDHARKCAVANAIGVPLYKVVDGVADLPNGWELDYETMYYLPPNVKLF